jgi:hypothetical protein
MSSLRHACSDPLSSPWSDGTLQALRKLPALSLRQTVYLDGKDGQRREIYKRDPFLVNYYGDHLHYHHQATGKDSNNSKKEPDDPNMLRWGPMLPPVVGGATAQTGRGEGEWRREDGGMSGVGRGGGGDERGREGGGRQGEEKASSAKISSKFKIPQEEDPNEDGHHPENRKSEYLRERPMGDTAAARGRLTNRVTYAARETVWPTEGTRYPVKT